MVTLAMFLFVFGSDNGRVDANFVRPNQSQGRGYHTVKDAEENDDDDVLLESGVSQHEGKQRKNLGEVSFSGLVAGLDSDDDLANASREVSNMIFNGHDLMATEDSSDSNSSDEDETP